MLTNKLSYNVKSLNICAQQYEENAVLKPSLFEYSTASSLGNAIASTPAFNANMSVSARSLPFGRMQPSTKGVFGNNLRAVAMTFAMSRGFGGASFAMAV